MRFLAVTMSLILSCCQGNRLDSSYEMEDYMGSTKSNRFKKLDETEAKWPAVSSTNTNVNENLEHPLRTDEWLIEFHIPILYRIYSSLVKHSLQPIHLLPSLPYPNLVNRYPDLPLKNSKWKQIMKFHPNGYVLVVEEFSTRKTRVGRWKMNQGILSWEIPVKLKSDGMEGDGGKLVRPLIQLQYNTDIHLNKFGKAPKMFRGVITRDRSFKSKLPAHMFRPVIATFTGVGIGHDTADVSYQERGIGLYNK